MAGQLNDRLRTRGGERSALTRQPKILEHGVTIAPYIGKLRAECVKEDGREPSNEAIARHLNSLGLKTSVGGDWYGRAVARLFEAAQSASTLNELCRDRGRHEAELWLIAAMDTNEPGNDGAKAATPEQLAERRRREDEAQHRGAELEALGKEIERLSHWRTHSPDAE